MVGVAAVHDGIEDAPARGFASGNLGRAQTLVDVAAVHDGIEDAPARGFAPGNLGKTQTLVVGAQSLGLGKP